MCPLVNRCSLQLLNINCTSSMCFPLYQTYIQQISYPPGTYKSVFNGKLGKTDFISYNIFHWEEGQPGNRGKKNA